MEVGGGWKEGGRREPETETIKGIICSSVCFPAKRAVYASPVCVSANEETNRCKVGLNAPIVSEELRARS